jgi:hypothetical protein
MMSDEAAVSALTRILRARGFRKQHTVMYASEAGASQRFVALTQRREGFRTADYTMTGFVSEEAFTRAKAACSAALSRLP